MFNRNTFDANLIAFIQQAQFEREYEEFDMKIFGAAVFLDISTPVDLAILIPHTFLSK